VSIAEQTFGVKHPDAASTNLRDAAAAYLDRGWPVVPVAGKRPPIPWKVFQKRLPTHDELGAWPWRQATGVAIVIGPGLWANHPNLWVLEIEARHRPDAERWLDAEVSHWRTAGLVVESGSGGLHLYCEATAPVRSSIYPWGEVRGAGNIAVLPPSLHPNGRRYRWLSDVEPVLLNPNEVPGVTAREYAERVPAGRETADTRTEAERSDADPIFSGCGYLRHVRDDAAGLPEPEWHAGLSIIGVCRDGVGLAHEVSRPHPAYTHKETEEKVLRARAEDKPLRCATIRHHRGGEEWCATCPSWDKITSPVQLGQATGTWGGDKTDKSPSVSSVSAQTGANERESWPERQPLPPEHPPAPLLPLEMVPEPLRVWVDDLADLAKLPREMIATPAVAAAGAVIGRNVGIRPGRFDAFVTVPNFWGAIVARPGWMKTAAMAEGFRPIGHLVARAIDAFKQAEEDAAVTRERIEVEIDVIKAKMKEGAKKGAALGEIEAALKAKRAELRDASPTERRYITHDATVEKLGELLRDNPRGLLLQRDEISGWLRLLEKNGREGDREFFLEAWNGTGSFTTDRIGRGTIHIPALTLSVFGSIQPGKLRPLIESATDGGSGDDGLLQRLQLVVWPDRLPPWKKPERYPDAAARDQAVAVYASLDAVTPSLVRAATDAAIPYLMFSPAAQLIADEWRDILETRMRSDELDDAPAFASHIAKYRSLMPELALTFHLLDVAAGIPRVANGAVGETSTRLACAWCDYLEAHAKKIYAVELTPGTSAARALAAKIETGAVDDGAAVRDVYRHQWTGLTTPDAVAAGLAILADLGWVRIEPSSTGGRPGQIIRIHPDLRQGDPDA
jgi:putative DNA primase/helicase